MAALSVVQILLIAAFAMSGIGKLFGGRTAVEGFRAMRYPEWFRVVTGLVEIVGAGGMVVAFWVPQAAIAAGAWMAATMLGALYTDLIRIWVPRRAAFAAVLLALAIATIALRVSAPA